MQIYPAVDLMGGACVRLEEGRFESKSVYSSDPVEMATRFRDAGASWIHIVDLDGARSGTPAHRELIREMAAETGLKVQTGGGLRDEHGARLVLEAGIDRVILGSMALAAPEIVTCLIGDFGAERIAVALDVRPEDDRYIVQTKGWTESSGRELHDEVEAFAGLGARHILTTDVSRDGLMAGPNIDLYRELAGRYPAMAFQASAGITSLDHIRDLEAAGAAGAVIGKAIYEGALKLEDLFGGE